MSTTQQQTTTDGYAYTALVLGVLAAALFWVPLLSLVIGTLALAVAWVALDRRQNRTAALIGLTAGAFGLLANIALIFFFA